MNVKVVKSLMLATVMMSCAQAYAFDYVVCRAYEFEELKTFSTEELQAKYNEYESIYNRIGTTPPENAREVQEDFNDKQKCSGEMERLKRIIDSRAKAEAKAKPTSKKKAGA